MRPSFIVPRAQALTSFFPSSSDRGTEGHNERKLITACIAAKLPSDPDTRQRVLMCSPYNLYQLPLDIPTPRYSYHQLVFLYILPS